MHKRSNRYALYVLLSQNPKGLSKARTEKLMLGVRAVSEGWVSALLCQSAREKDMDTQMLNCECCGKVMRVYTLSKQGLQRVADAV